MKKVKLMLLSLSILAVVGGALAFTVRTGTTYCTAPTILDANGFVTFSTFCNVAPNKIKAQAGFNVATTTTSGIASDPCPLTLRCFATNPNKTIE